ncbi:protein of unknown function [Burkholderia multivorans]
MSKSSGGESASLIMETYREAHAISSHPQHRLCSPVAVSCGSARAVAGSSVGAGEHLRATPGSR